VKKTQICVLLAFCCAMVSSASAQKNELAGLIGRTFVGSRTIQGTTALDDKLRMGYGLTFEANYARHLLTSPAMGLSLEVPLVVNPDEDLHAALPSQVPQQYSSFFVTPSARLNFFPDLAVSPWVSIGGGFSHYGASSNLLFGGKNPASTGTTTGALQVGAGVDVKLAGAFRLRGEFRDFWTAVPELNVTIGGTHQHNLFVAGGVAWQF
jgi:hypothetical protein